MSNFTQRKSSSNFKRIAHFFCKLPSYNFNEAIAHTATNHPDLKPSSYCVLPRYSFQRMWRTYLRLPEEPRQWSAPSVTVRRTSGPQMARWLTDYHSALPHLFRSSCSPGTPGLVTAAASTSSSGCWSSSPASSRRASVRSPVPSMVESSATGFQDSSRSRGNSAAAIRTPWRPSASAPISDWRNVASSFGTTGGTVPLPRRPRVLSSSSLPSVRIHSFIHSFIPDNYFRVVKAS